MKKSDCMHLTRQRGIALVMGLIFLAVLTLLSVAAMRGTLLEERMAGNSRDRDLAFQSAELALRAGEAVLSGAVLPAFATGTPYTPRIAAGAQRDYWIDTHDWGTAAAAVAAAPANTAAAPRFVIEQLNVTSGAGGGGLGFGALSESGVYRVTARGVGQSANTVVILQAVFNR